MGIFLIAGFVLLTLVPPIFLIGVGGQSFGFFGALLGVVTWLAIGLGLNAFFTRWQNGSPNELVRPTKARSGLKKLLWLIPEAWAGWVSPLAWLTARLMGVGLARGWRSGWPCLE